MRTCALAGARQATASSAPKAPRACREPSARKAPRPEGSRSSAQDAVTTPLRLGRERRGGARGGAAAERSAAVVSDSTGAASRRQLCLGGLASASAVFGPIQAAEATKIVPGAGADGADVEAFEFAVQLQAVALRGSIPQQQIVDFKTLLGPTARPSVETLPSLEAIWHSLLKGKSNVSTADAVSLGDSYLSLAIRAGKLQPIPDAQRYRWWSRLAPCWQQLVLRDSKGMLAAANKGGQVWAAPYRWGCTLICYRKDKLARAGARPIRDWQDLLQPALKQRVSFIESPREVIGAAFKGLTTQYLQASGLGGGKLGYNAGPADLRAAGVSEDEAKHAVRELVGQVKVYSNTDHIRAVNAEDCWVVVGWSEELIKMAKRSSNLVLVAPSSGTALWSDLWAVPSGAMRGHNLSGPSPLLPLWVDYSLQPQKEQASRGLQSGGASPLLLQATRQSGAAAPRSHATSATESSSMAYHGMDSDSYLPHSEVLDRSEFLLPCSHETMEAYGRILSS